MKIETGHPLTNDVVELNAKYVRFVSDDGRAAFEVSIGDDGRSIEVRGVDTYKVDGKLYCERFVVRPRASNSVDILSCEWGD